MMGDELHWLDATAQAELVRKGEVTPVELVEHAARRIEALNPRINAVIHDLVEKALDAAAAATDLADGPFRGVPMLVKDAVCHTAGDPFHCGMQVLKDIDWHEPDDTWLAQRFRAAGFLISGKANLPELASAITTEPRAYGPTRNPWSLGRSAGGSSGGSAAAVASGMVPVAHGNDMGGSIRVPASACGLVGLKPTRARATLGPDFGEYWAMTTHEHVLTRTVRDSAGVLDAIRGPGAGDPYTAPPPPRPYVDEVGADPGRLRIGFRTLMRDGLGESGPECVAAVHETARLLDALGHVVEPTDIPALDDPLFATAFPTLFGSFISRDLERWSTRIGRPIGPDDVEPANGFLAQLGNATSANQYVAAIENVHRWSRGVAGWWDDHDVLLLPVLPNPPLPIGELGPETDDPLDLMTRVGGQITFTVPFNLTGQPAISLPLHLTPDGIPVGVQLVAAYGREDVLFRMAAQLEAARPWGERRPALAC